MKIDINKILGICAADMLRPVVAIPFKEWENIILDNFKESDRRAEENKRLKAKIARLERIIAKLTGKK